MTNERVHLVGEYILDRARGCLLRAGEPVHLRPQAYELLCCLVEHRGRLVGKEQLIRSVWQGRAVADDSIVQCLRDVRQALGSDGQRLIRTVRGRGYLLDVPAVDEPVAALVTDHTEITRVVVEEHESDDESVGAPRSEALALPQAAKRWSARLAWAAAIAAVALTVAMVAYRQTRGSGGRPAINAIAVLPFVNATGDADAEYLADGLTESLINHLVQGSTLSVKARSAVFAYKGQGLPPDRIAGDLGVDALVTGRAIRRGDDVTMYVSLVDGRTGDQLWGEQYTRPISSLAPLPEDIAADVASRLQRRLEGGAGSASLKPGYTPAGDAYLLYLRGRYHQFRTNEADMRTAIRFYEKAAAADPRSALPHAGLADAFRSLAIIGNLPSREAFPQSHAAALRALELDPNLVDAHVALGWILFYFAWDWAGAERELVRAIELNPGSPDAHRAYAHMLSNYGRHAEALVEAERARELDPRSLITNMLSGQFLFYAGKLDEADRRFERTLEIDPTYWPAHQGLGRVLILRERFAEAAVRLRTAVDLSSNATEPVTQLGYALARAGDAAGARAILRELEATAGTRYVPAYSFAMVRNGLGDPGGALSDLERSVEQRELQATFIRVDTRWDALRPEPRFVALLSRLDLD